MLTYYMARIGKILLAADEIGLVAMFFEDDKFFTEKMYFHTTNQLITDNAKDWLRIYFARRKPKFMPPLHLTGTPFQISVYEEILKIPYGKTTTYGAIAKTLNTSARAVGHAIAHNPISIIVPCHRVIGADGDLRGYAGGLEKKAKLLKLEGSL